MRKKFTMLLASLFLVMGTAWAQTLADGVYTIKNVINKRGTLVAVDGQTNVGAASIELGGYENLSETAMPDGDKWYVRTVDGKTFLYNIANKKFIGTRTANEAKFVADPVVGIVLTSCANNRWRIVNGDYTIGVSLGWGKGNSIRWLTGSEDNSMNLDFAVVENGATTFANQIAEANATIDELYANAFDPTKLYRVYNKKKNDNGTYADTEDMAWSPEGNHLAVYNADAENQLWRFIQGTGNNAEKYLIYNVATEKYMREVVGSNGVQLTANENEAVYYTMKKHASEKKYAFYSRNEQKYHLFNDGGGKLAGWTANDNEYFTLEAVEVSVDVTYSFKFDGVEKYTQTESLNAGDKYPDFKFTLPYGVSAAAKPAGRVGLTDVNKDVELTISSLPFEFSDSYANAVWYYMPLHNSDKNYLSYAENQEFIPLGNDQKVLPAEGHDAYLWAFVGDPFTGYKIMNKAAGETKILSSSTTMTKGDGATYPVMIAEASLPQGYNTYWIPSSASSYATNGFFLEQKGYSGNKMNRRDGKLAYWTGGADGGSTFRVTTIADGTDFENIAALKAVAGKVGYPKLNSNEYTALAGLEQGRTTKLEAGPAISNFKKSSNIVLPEDGKAYTFTALFQNGNKLYMKYVDGQKVSVSANSSDASTFVCKELSAGVYAFITEDGKILTWVGNDEGGAYKENDKILGYSSYYATEYNGKSDWNDITVKKNETHEEQLGLLRLVGRRHSTTTSSIIANKAVRFDQASDGNWFNNDNTSGWILTEVEHTNNDVQNLALARVGAKNTIGGRTFGEGIGKYHYVFGGQNVYALDVDEIATIDEINAAVATFAINQPAAGFYRIKSMNRDDAEKKGRFLEADATGMKLAKDDNNPDNKYTSVFYVKDNTILSYSCGQYLNNYQAFAAVGAEPTSWVIEENADIVGAYALKYEENEYHNGYLSDWLPIPTATEEDPQPVFNPTYGRNDYNAAWTLEAVTWLPVAMNAEIGYATLYSPVQLALSFGRVKAYTGTVNRDWLTLNEKDVIPANEGVVLELQEGAQIENGCVFLEVTGSGETVEGNALKGTLATKAAPTNEGTIYTLQREQEKDENGNVVGYLNSVVFGIYANEDNSVPNLKGFRAYLPISTANPTESISIRFEGTTDIEHSEIRNQHSEMIFDLLGRRVEAITKGGIYIVNGKKVVVK